jgi:hydroxymethylglutaryl-CoA synthase
MALVERAAAAASAPTARPAPAAPRPAAAASNGASASAPAPAAAPNDVGVLAMEVYFPLHYVRFSFCVSVLRGRGTPRVACGGESQGRGRVAYRGARKKKKRRARARSCAPCPRALARPSPSLPLSQPKNKTQVDQEDLEAADGAPAGKYTAGLGQRALAFADGDAEDAASMALSALAALLEKTGTPPSRVGWLSVGTESAPDRSKSVKTTLMRLFNESGNHDVQGVDAVNACYGGTAALFSAVAWVQSPAWDGRLAAVVASDIAAYAPGPARPSGGCGSVAMLVGPGAPLVLEPGLCATHARDEWDFWRPAGPDPWPRVDAPLSVACYLECLDACYAGLVAKAGRVSEKKGGATAGVPPLPPRWPAPHPSHSFSLSTGAAFFVGHAPYGKLLRKALARLVATDARRAAAAAGAAAEAGAATLVVGPPPGFDERAAVAATAPSFESVVAPGAWLAAEVGNMYTASVWAGLAALVERVGAAGLDRQRVLLFSYGSGAVASLFGVRCREGGGEGRDGGRFTLSTLASSLGIAARLAARVRRSPADLDASLALAAAHHTSGPGPAGWTPAGGGAAAVRPGAFYLAGVDAQARRTYARRPVEVAEESHGEGGGGDGSGEGGEGGRTTTANGSHAAARPPAAVPQVQPFAAAPSTGDLEAAIRVG